MIQPVLLSPKQVAEHFGIAVQTLADWRSTGRHDLPFVKIGRLVRYRESDVQDFLDGEEQTDDLDEFHDFDDDPDDDSDYDE